MATTTNYGWTTPDDTALVKDGAAAIRTLGSSVDTSVKALSPGTTAGDLDYYTTSTAKARLGIGTAGQVLTVNGGATAPSWATPAAGGMTLLSTTSLTGATTVISSISQSYKTLVAIVSGVTNATADERMRIAPNGTTNIVAAISSNISGGVAAWDQRNASYLYLSIDNVDRTSTSNAWAVKIDNYASATAMKPFLVNGGYYRSAGSQTGYVSSGYIYSTTAISSLTFSSAGGNLSTGTVLLYGVS
jgi:hypothetical protein